ncbi:sortase [Schumannella soli]|uniref:Sortase n=1 Tax=Schumannella soli TaxID=2590779 RepID=A0A506Y7N8_9MICO|nr:sortase [Schumannella soli]
MLITAVLLVFAFLVQVVVLSQLQHLESQQRLRDSFRAQLAAGTAPVSEADYTGKMLRSTSPVGILSIPQIGVSEVLVEGTDSDTLKTGAGHRRDTPLPGQPGISVLIGRAGAYGGPFSHIQELAPGDRFSVRTGQGKSTFEVIGVRYAGDPTPAALARGGSRLVLQSARGPAFAPSGVVYVDARLVSPVMDAGARWTTTGALPPEERALQADTREVWSLVFALQFLLAAHLGAAWARRRVGSRKTWLVGAPVVALAVLLAADRIVPLLPNVL